MSDAYISLSSPQSIVAFAFFGRL